MTEPIGAVRLTREEFNLRQGQGTAGYTWGFADLGIAWPTDYWVAEPVDGELRLRVAVVLARFTVFGTVDTAAQRFALSHVLVDEYSGDSLGGTGVPGVEPYHEFIWALSYDEAAALARASVETPAP